MAAIVAISFAVSLMIFLGYRDWAFYSPVSRAWELLAGGILANYHVADPKRERRSSARRDNLQATIGVIAILGAALGSTGIVRFRASTRSCRCSVRC